MLATAHKVDTAALYKAAHFHRFEVFHSERCACFSCMQSFSPNQIVEWTDKDMTALCPHCKMDAVLPDYNGTPINRETLVEMNQYTY